MNIYRKSQKGLASSSSRGFTLIELLVVIAIIGILSSVVLASLNTARDKGADASIKSNVNNSRVQAELFYDENSLVYTDVCTTNSAGGGIADFLIGATNAGSAAVDCDDSATEWAFEAQLKSSTDYYCVDSTGKAGESTSSKGATATAC